MLKDSLALNCYFAAFQEQEDKLSSSYFTISVNVSDPFYAGRCSLAARADGQRIKAFVEGKSAAAHKASVLLLTLPVANESVGNFIVPFVVKIAQLGDFLFHTHGVELCTLIVEVKKLHVGMLAGFVPKY